MAIEFLHPNGDVTTNWDEVVPSGTHWTALDEDPVKEPNDGDFIKSKTAGDDDRWTIDDTAQGAAEDIFQIFVRVRAQINDPASTGKIRIELFHSGSTSLGTKDIIGADLGGYGKIGVARKDYTGLSLNDTQGDSLEMKATLLAS